MGITDAQKGKRFFSVKEAYAVGDPYSHDAWFREHDPVHAEQPGWPLGHPQIWLFRHADVMRWLRDPRLVMRVDDIPEFQALRESDPREEPAQDTFGFVANRMILFQDPPDLATRRGASWLTAAGCASGLGLTRNHMVAYTVITQPHGCVYW